MGSVRFDGEDESLQPSTSNGKNFKLPRTILDSCCAVNHVSVPKKLRSAIKKRGRENVTIPLPISRKKYNVSNGVETLGKNGAKKSKRNKKQGKITKDEEEVAEALYALSGMFSNSNKANELPEAKSPAIQEVERSMNSIEDNESDKINSTAEIAKSQSLSGDKNYHPMDNKNNGLFPLPPQGSKSQGSHKRIPAWLQKTNCVPTIDQNSTEKDAVEPSKSWKRCTAHMYISRLIKVLQLSERNEGLLENKPTEVAITLDDSNKDSAEIQNELLNKRPVQDQPESSGLSSRKQDYNFLALGTGVCGLEARKGVNGAALSHEVNEQFYVQPQNHSPMFFLPPHNEYSSTFHGHNSALAAQQVQMQQYVNSSFTSQLQTWYNNGGGGGPHLPEWRNGGIDAPSMVNYAHTIFPHVHASALGSKYHQQFSSPHQQIMSLSNVKKHNESNQDYYRLGFGRNIAAFCPESIPQFQLPCNQRL